MVELAGVGGWRGGAERGASATPDRERYQEKKGLGLEKGYIYILQCSFIILCTILCFLSFPICISCKYPTVDYIYIRMRKRKGPIKKKKKENQCKSVRFRFFFFFFFSTLL